ncbi:MAG: N-acetylmuramoyl-L-alanine amidase [Prolixibacteraceae bacterium]|nr:N-acetylmuramoyl-L-alanine amidase [Prolixibacteraceae bacterium]
MFKIANLTRYIRLLFILNIFILGFSATPLAQEYPTIKAKKGDGIYSVLKQNGYSPADYLDQFIELNKTKLGKDNTLITGRTYKLPIKPSPPSQKTDNEVSAEKKPEKKNYEIFGQKNREISIKSSELEGAVYYLMSGHGGPDPGAIGKLKGHLLCEDEYAYDVTLRLARNLVERGATIYMIIRDTNDGIRDEQFLSPDKDEVCYPNHEIPLSQLARLKQGTDAVNDLHAANKGKFQRLVVIHVDSRSKKENIDVFFYHDKSSSTGKKLATTLKQTFEQKYAMHQPNRGYEGTVSDRNLYVTKNSFVPAVFIELGNINHTKDQQRFIIADNRQAVANWLRDGLIEDYKKSLK